jgi:hypothetical protein
LPIEVGERALSRDDAGELTYREVTRVFRRVEAELTFTDAHGALQHLVTTPEHPLHVAGAGWVPAGELAVGAEVATAEGGLARLSAALSLEKRGEVFNLEVEGTHSYFVGDAQLWVHNMCTRAGGGPPVNRAGAPYPEVRHPGTGGLIPHPGEGLSRVPPADRAPWGARERGAFIKEWYDRGFSTPEGGWAKYDIHHIRPREYGGTNAFDNLVPVERSVHQSAFNPWWRDY